MNTNRIEVENFGRLLPAEAGRQLGKEAHFMCPPGITLNGLAERVNIALEDRGRRGASISIVLLPSSPSTTGSNLYYVRVYGPTLEQIANIAEAYIDRDTAEAESLLARL